MRKVLSCVMILTAGPATVAAAELQPPVVLGMAPGQPITLPECRHMVFPGGHVSPDLYEHEPVQTCYEADIPLSDAPWRRGAVDFPSRQAPLIISGSGGYTLIIDGKLEGLQFDTLGPSDAAGIIRELSTKFGRPSLVSRITSVIGGVPVPATQADWHRLTFTCGMSAPATV